ncbi:P-loop NTPase family protein [Paracoccus sphaerophysae]|uniref:Chromosomal replication initiator protein DnaA n=1 Tax=Paracoccus sphaerophysae TaxID=690417 RepID=A0A099FI15_9RHOB|nr:chromosomal replication initiator protein DnaA [Paracoccus sphaerophysae]KGJ09697.1 chromosomal replication initiator protein DnaA [Paracoccus sphaerophysae]
MARQLTFDLGLTPALGRADFLPAPANAAALAMVDRPQDWPQGRLLLVGPEASGKSHIASFWAGEHGARVVRGGALRVDAADALAPEAGALVIDDADRVAHAAGAEQALFHLWNLSAARGTLLLMAARAAPRDWGLVLPDLASRMASVAVARLGAPDEALLGAVLVKLLADRQLTPGPGVVEALVRHMDRDLALARRLVAEIDRTALAEGRGVTRPLALDALARLTGAGGEASDPVANGS